jgi:hypothetical protein
MSTKPNALGCTKATLLLRLFQHFGVDGSKIFPTTKFGNFLAARVFTRMDFIPKHSAGRMHSLVRKIRSFLEASWASSPTVVGLTCVTLDLAALLHLRIKAAQPVATAIVRQRGPRE